MHKISPLCGLGTLVTHLENDNDEHAHVSPIYQTSTFGFPDVAYGAGIVDGSQPGYYYTRIANPNLDQAAAKIAFLEGLDLLRKSPQVDAGEFVAGMLFASGMSAISSAILARVHAGETIIAQESIYGNTFNFLHDIAPGLGFKIAWVNDASPAGWERAFTQHPGAVLAYAETPANPTLLTVDLAAVARLAHRSGCWLMVDNTFATPYCQRPLSLGADIVAHSTTKYLSGHGVIIGGVVVSPHVDFIHKDLKLIMKTTGGSPSPFDAWLLNLGLKTFELRMQRHCENALVLASYLEKHAKVARVYYPGLESHPDHELARRQMSAFGGMISFELKGGIPSGIKLMNSVRLISLAVSLGMVDSLISHPASMTHAGVPRDERLKMGLTDGLVRFSVGIENVEDIVADFEQALGQV
jgi:methionine-gamma-lyase